MFVYVWPPVRGWGEVTALQADGDVSALAGAALRAPLTVLVLLVRVM